MTGHNARTIAVRFRYDWMLFGVASSTWGVIAALWLLNTWHGFRWVGIGSLAVSLWSATLLRRDLRGHHRMQDLMYNEEPENHA